MCYFCTFRSTNREDEKAKSEDFEKARSERASVGSLGLEGEEDTLHLGAEGTAFNLAKLSIDLESRPLN